MNRLVFLAVFGLATVAMVSAHRNGGGGDSGSRDRDGWGWLGGILNQFRRCQCSSTQCTGNSGTNNFGCSTNRTAYIQCQETVCSVQACPANSLFNSTSRQCQPCPAGFHVDAYQRKCVCDQGTTFNRTTQTCTPCPTNAVVTADSCYCYASALSRPDNACKACPTGSTMNFRGFQCKCNDCTKSFKNNTDKPFWSENDFACKQCPGAWVNKTATERRGRRTYSYPVQKCQCQGTNEVFNEYQVACVTCPANSVLVTYGYDTSCQCSLTTQKYNYKTNTCVDRDADSSSNSREWRWPF